MCIGISNSLNKVCRGLLCKLFGGCRDTAAVGTDPTSVSVRIIPFGNHFESYENNLSLFFLCFKIFVIKHLK